MSDLNDLPIDMYDDWYFERDRDNEPYNAEFEECIGESEKAWLLGMPDGREIWFPKSVCQLRRWSRTIVMPTWLASKKGLR